jgi:hypothetical protein
LLTKPGGKEPGPGEKKQVIVITNITIPIVTKTQQHARLMLYKRKGFDWKQRQKLTTSERERKHASLRKGRRKKTDLYGTRWRK